MGRFSRVTASEESAWKKQQDIDRAYTLLLYAKRALEKCGDDYCVAKIEGIMFDYRQMGAVARYEYAPIS